MIFMNDIFSPLGVHHSEISNQRTAFKSLGLAIEDFVAAKMACEAIKTSSPWPVEFIESQKVKEMAQTITGSVQTVLEFIVASGEIQYIFAPK